MGVKLYKLNASPPVRAVCMIIEALNLKDVEYIDVNLVAGEHLTEEYLKLNPQHTVPTLQDEDFVLWDSHAITTYLIGKYGENDKLYPADLKKRAIIDQRLHFDSGILFPAIRESLVAILYGGEKAFRPESLKKIKSAYEFMEKFLAQPWLAGDELTLADVCCVASISSLDLILPIQENEYPKLRNWYSRCSEQEIYKKANEKGLLELHEIIKFKLA